MTKTICLFNHKGGVSKTTTAFNLGWALAEQGKRVLLVDLDSQCNLTGLVMGYNAMDESKMDAFYASRSNLTMKQVVDAVIEGLSPERFIEQEKGDLLKTKHKNLSLLPGHLDVADLDSQISISLKIASGVPATRNIPGNLPKMLQTVAERRSGSEAIDYTIYDLSPNVGGLNEVVLMSSDYFIVPTSPDYFCLQAVDSLEKNITKWHTEIQQFKKVNGSASASSIHNQPQLLGAIQQRYRPRNERPAKSFQKWMDDIRERIKSVLVPSLAEIGCVVEKTKIEQVLKGTDLEPYDLANIPDFNSLMAISQQLEKPAFALTDEEIKNTGKVFGHAESTMLESRSTFKQVFTELAERVLALTSTPR
jgi:chromosome partitioning protein